ncbi:MAG: hypothetical protein Q8S33_38230 [Myxococcales bacterium]|nr:hypothetical protein [Myxococcales bacterium]MDP3506241.1 hypothetical protein [Myxococcales bacterium]
MERLEHRDDLVHPGVHVSVRERPAVLAIAKVPNALDLPEAGNGVGPDPGAHGSKHVSEERFTGWRTSRRGTSEGRCGVGVGGGGWRVELEHETEPAFRRPVREAVEVAGQQKRSRAHPGFFVRDGALAHRGPQSPCRDHREDTDKHTDSESGAPFVAAFVPGLGRHGTHHEDGQHTSEGTEHEPAPTDEARHGSSQTSPRLVGLGIDRCLRGNHVFLLGRELTTTICEALELIPVAHSHTVPATRGTSQMVIET